MVDRPVSGAHYGLRDWLAQRLSAVIMVGYTAFVLIFMLKHAPVSVPEWQDFMRQNITRYLTFLFFLALLIHAWVGMRDVFMDYVRGTGLRLTLEVITLLLLLIYGFWAAHILWR